MPTHAPMPTPQIVEESEERVKVVSKANPEEGIFPLKQRDDAIAAGGLSPVWPCNTQPVLSFA